MSRIVKFVITPDLLTLVNPQGDELTVIITPEQHYDLIKTGLMAIRFNTDRFVWWEPALGFMPIVEEIFRRRRNSPIHHWLLNTYVTDPRY